MSERAEPVGPQRGTLFCVLAALACLGGCGPSAVAPRDAEPQASRDRRAHFVPYVAPTDAIDWVDDVAEGRRRAHERGVHLMVYVSTSWCGPCKRLKAHTFKDKSVIRAINTQAVPVRVDGDSPAGRAYCRKHRISSYPTLLFERPDGTEVDRAFGYRNPRNFNKMFDDMLADRNTISDWRRRLAATPDNPQLLLQFGQHLALRGEVAAAEKALRRVMVLDPQGARGFGDKSMFTLARYVFEMKRRNPRGALKIYRELIQRFPRSPIVDSARLRSAAIHSARGERDQAMALISTVATRQPLNAGRLLRGVVLAQRSGAHPSTLMEWAKAACKLRKDGYPWFVLAGLHQQMGNTQAQVDALREATRRSPRQATYRNAYEAARAALEAGGGATSRRRPSGH